MILPIQISPKFNMIKKHYNFAKEHMNRRRGGAHSRAPRPAAGWVSRRTTGGMHVLVEHHALGLWLAVQKKKSKKVVQTKICMILSLIFTPDPLFEVLLSILSMISIAALTG
jgi:hypothetical protein